MLKFSQSKNYKRISGIVTSTWILSLYKKVFLFSYYQNFKCVVLTLLERFLKLFSFVFPLKTILILNSGNVPLFLLEIIPNLTLELLVIFLTVATLISYYGVLKISTNINNNISKTAIIIENHNKKTSSNINISSGLKNNYSLIIKSISAIFFFSIILFLILFLDQSIAWLLVFVTMLFLVIIFLSAKYDFLFEFEYFVKNREKIQKIWLYLSFAIIFLFILNKLIISSFLSDRLLNLAIIFFLCRYSINAANEFINHLFKIFLNYLNVSNLFFFNSIHNKYTTEVKLNKILNISKIKYIADKILLSCSKDIKLMSIHLSRISSNNNICFDLVVENKKLNNEKKFYLLKIFDQKHNFLAIHELNIVKNNTNKNYPVPKVLNNLIIDEFNCILFEKFNKSIISQNQYLNAAKSILINMWSVPIEDKILNSYLRTQGYNTPEVISESIELIQTYSHSSKLSNNNLLKLDSMIKEISDYISKLPIVLYNKNLGRVYLDFSNIHNKAICYNWSEWSLNPIGSNLGSFKNLFDDNNLTEILQIIKKKRKDCFNLNIHDLRLTETYFNLIDFIKKNKINSAYNQALKLASLFLVIKDNDKKK